MSNSNADDLYYYILHDDSSCLYINNVKLPTLDVNKSIKRQAELQDFWELQGSSYFICIDLYHMNRICRWYKFFGENVYHIDLSSKECYDILESTINNKSKIEKYKY